MIEIAAILVILAVAGFGSSGLSSDDETDTHTMVCLGVCAHFEEKTDEILISNPPVVCDAPLCE